MLVHFQAHFCRMRIASQSVLPGSNLNHRPFMTVLVRPATTQDAEAACKVLRKSIADCCFEDHHGDPQILAAWLNNKSPENVAGWFQDPANFAVVADSGDKVIGVALLTADGEVALCYLLPEMRFKGVGKLLLLAIEAEATYRKISALRLDSTATGRSFYLRNGFQASGLPIDGWGIKGYPMLKLLQRI